MNTIQVLLAEDNAGDVFLVEEALREHNIPFKLHLAVDGVGVQQYLDRLGEGLESPCPDVFLLDLNLPKCDGHEILTNFRAHPACSHVPVIIVTSSDAPKDRLRADLLGATSYFRKPSDLTEFLKLGELVCQAMTKRHGTNPPIENTLRQLP